MEEIVLKRKYLFKMNYTLHNFYFKNEDNNPKIEYSEHNNTMTKKKYLDLKDIEKYSKFINEKNNGMISINLKNKEIMELYSNNQGDYYGFIEELEKYNVKLFI